jgi:hypothetical protein
MLAVIGNDGLNLRRLVFFAISVFATDAVTVVTHVVFVIMNVNLFTVSNDLLCDSVHLWFGGMALFLLHPAGPEYSQMTGFDAANRKDDDRFGCDDDLESSEEDFLE